MSGRFQTHTVASEGAELDDNYQKMVADIEEQTQRSGWLFGRGAFDKGDLQYLRDFNSSLRYKEVEIEDKERELWERERARIDAEAAAAAARAVAEAAALTRRSSGGSSAPGLRGPPGVSSRPAPLLLPVKVKPSGSRQQQTPRAGSPGDPPSCKRARTDSASNSAAGGGGGGALTSPLSTSAALSAAAAASGGELRSAKSEPGPASTSTSAGGAAPAGTQREPGATVNHRAATQSQPHLQQSDRRQVTAVRSQSAPDVAGTGGGTSGEKADGGGRGSGGTASGLASLLGGYGSEDEEDNADGDAGGGGGAGGCLGINAGDDRSGLIAGRQQQQRAGSSSGLETGVAAGRQDEIGPKLPPPIGLLSPEDLLADPRVIVEGLLATRPQPQDVQGGDAWDSEEAESD